MDTNDVRRLALGLLLVPLAAGCGIIGPTVCTTDSRPAIVVEVLDSISGDPARGPVQIVLRDGSVTLEFDSQDVPLPAAADPDTVVFGPFQLAHEREGTYEVTVQGQGYRLWRRTGVRVTHDGCHVRTAELTALLQPE